MHPQLPNGSGLEPGGSTQPFLNVRDSSLLDLNSLFHPHQNRVDQQQHTLDISRHSEDPHGDIDAIMNMTFADFNASQSHYAPSPNPVLGFLGHDFGQSSPSRLPFLEEPSSSENPLNGMPWGPTSTNSSWPPKIDEGYWDALVGQLDGEQVISWGN
jgi:hypothetical protein